MMMMVIASIFAFVNFFNGLFFILKYYDVLTGLTILYLDSVSDFLETTNSCINIVIYGIFNTKFRRALKEMCCSCFQQGHQLEVLAPVIPQRLLELKQDQTSSRRSSPRASGLAWAETRVTAETKL